MIELDTGAMEIEKGFEAVWGFDPRLPETFGIGPDRTPPRFVYNGPSPSRPSPIAHYIHEGRRDDTIIPIFFPIFIPGS